MATIAEQLASYAHRLRYEDLPQEVVHEVKRRVIDSLACAVGAFHSEPGRIAREFVLSVSAERGATVLGAKHKTSPDLAAFANGTLVRYLDFNDTYLSKEPAHPSDNIPAALAVAEAEGRSGKDLILAITIGYEIQCRLADAAELRRWGWDHVNYGLFSTTCLASRLLGLTEEQTVHAVSLAGVGHLALRQTRVGELSMWKACAFANAARNGVFAALLAQRGMTGPSEIFEGKFGFFNLISGQFELQAFGGVGEERFKILDSSIKFFPAEYHAQSAIEAALELRKEISSVDDITEINAFSFDACVDIIASEPEKWKPTTRETADHSLPYCIAVALADGEVTLRQFEPERIADPKLHELMQKIKVHRDPNLSSRYPQAIPNRLEITLRSTDKLVSEVAFPKGHARNPMSDAEVEAKFRTLSEGVLSSPQVDKILERLWQLDEMGEVGELIALFNLTG